MSKNSNANNRSAAVSEEDALFEQELRSQAAEVGAVRAANGINVTEPAVNAAGEIQPPVKKMTMEEALKSNDPIARQTVIEDCMYRNRVTKPARAKKWYEVESVLGKNRQVNILRVEAHDEIDAIAVANTTLKITAGPAGRRVTQVS